MRIAALKPFIMVIPLTVRITPVLPDSDFAVILIRWNRYPVYCITLFLYY